ncbi:DUF257 family protein [Thermococcus stetteri]|uniref:DUF257 family protein n=1 Tax=Thermococcus stetteri TaxID=49900 RepID=UPI001AE8AA4A|nr:DUF257 family protein [Thermococcus stetteri]MBP1911378.1 hypothetical protein [Thermococcus stetteri]
MLQEILKALEVGGGLVLVEYSSLDHPELVFADILNTWREKGIKPLVVDIGNTLHVFTAKLKMIGVSVKVNDLPVIKELGNARVGNIIGEVHEVEDFDYHMAKYAQIAKKVPEESRKHTIVLGMERFSFTFMDNPPKLERYFEKINRRYLKYTDVKDVIFLNTSVASEYLTKSLEQDYDYVLRLKGTALTVVKTPGGEVVELQ